ncbi:MAG: hypothetical protein Q9187_002164 [Circinaria calcarea]
MSLNHTATGPATLTYQDNAAPTIDHHSHSPSGTDKTHGMQVDSESFQPEKPRAMGMVSWICVVISLLFSMFLFSLDNVIVADVQPSIINSLGNIDKLPWVSVAYALGAIAINLFMSKLFGQFNNKFLFITGVIIFEAGSAICGAAPTMTVLILGRAICGVGGVGIYLGAMNLLSVLTTEAERPVYLSFVGLTWGLGTVSATWRWSFYLNLCVGAIVGPIYIFLLPSYNPRPEASILSRIRELDWVGAVLNAGAFTSLVMAIAFGGGVYPWNSGQIIALFTCAGILWILFTFQQALSIFTTNENRLFPVALIRSWEMNILFAQIASAMVVIYIPLYFIPLYFQFVQNDTALHAGVRLLPFVFLQVFGVIFNGAIMSKFGYYMPWYLLGGVLSVIGGALFRTVGVSTSTSIIYGYSVLLGLGSGLFTQASYAVAQAKVDAKAIPLAIAFIGCGQITGITLALTISNSVFLNEATNKISGILPLVPRPVVQQAISGANGAFFNTLDTMDRAKVLNAIVRSIDNVYGMVLTAGGMVTLLSLLMKRERLFLQPPTASVKKAEKEVEKGLSLSIS